MKLDDKTDMAKNKIILWVTGLCILFPLFFQIQGGVYRNTSPMIDSNGVLVALPLPLSIFTCLGVLFVLRQGIRLSLPAVWMVCGTILVGCISIWLGGDGSTSTQRKWVICAQVLLPMIGLLLGQLISDPDGILAKAFLVVISVVVPLQLIATWAQGGLILTHYLYAFSIYSHFQYVTLIFVCAFAYSVVTLWDKHWIWLSILAIPMFVYITASLSFLTIFAYLAFFVAFVLLKLWLYRGQAVKVVVAVTAFALVAFGVSTYFGQMAGQRTQVEGHQGSFYGKFKGLSEGKIPLNVQERFDDWKLFGAGVIDSKKTLVFGHSQPMPREIKSSPHNWYLDIAYTFGLIGLLPIAGLIGITTYLVVSRRRKLSAQTWWLVAIVFYLVLIDSNFKVTLRQPYPGIFAYFLWGLLLTRLSAHAKANHSG